MRVTIIDEVEYTPIASDHRSCWGSLHRRPGSAVDGKCGPMVYYFPKGRTPELRDEIAAKFIADKVAVPFDDEPTIDKTTAEILEGMAVTT